MYIKKTLQTYLNDLSAKKPTPGGGSVAALVGANGAALTLMVAEFSQKNQQLTILTKEAKKNKADFLYFIDKDVKEFKKVALAYKKPTKTAAQIISRKRAICQALISVLKVSEDICSLCYKGIKLSASLVKIGNKNLITDTAISSLLFEAAFKSSLYNVKINLKCLKDDKFAHSKIAKYKKIERQIINVRKEVLKNVDKCL
ncbi:MAG: cyclodeaminase/cyclohydrolase family protein [Candidatus Kappaea frigidicola]|nr:cyclodeaminase/cyclohydrolase family protein [Candidatus Kappaea frigidicola]